jgi:U4/U6.U5 tri-snRNP-associated protein 1
MNPSWRWGISVLTTYLSRAKNRSALNSKLKGSTLGDAGQEQDADVSAQSWIRKQKRRAKQREKELAEKREKEMAEQEQAVYDESEWVGSGGMYADLP